MFNVYGKGQNENYSGVITKFLKNIANDKPIVIYGDGEQKRCFSFVADDVEPLFRLAEDAVTGEVINIGPDEEFVTINHLAEVLAHLLDFKLDPIRMAGRPQEVKLANCSADKARRLLDYKTSVTLEEGLQQTIDYIKDRGPKPFSYHLDLEIVTDRTPKTWKDKLM